MSKLEGGIFSRPRGKTGGIVFGAARTRRGKQVTSRLLVPPSNPNTAAQQSQRGKFGKSLALVKAWGPDFYRGAMNRTVSQLPGFQSLLSIILSNITASGSLYDPMIATLLRGSNPLPQGLSRSIGSGEVTFTWDTTPGQGGSADDEVFIASVANGPGGVDMSTVQFHTGQKISDGATGYTIDNSPQEEFYVFLYTKGSGSNEGIYSNILYGIDVGA